MKTTEKKNRIEESLSNIAQYVNSKKKSLAKNRFTKKNKTIFIFITSFVFIGIMLTLDADIETAVKPEFSNLDSVSTEYFSTEPNLVIAKSADMENDISKIFQTELTDKPLPVFDDSATYALPLALPVNQANNKVQHAFESQAINSKSTQAINSKIIQNIPNTLASAKKSSHKTVELKSPPQKPISFAAMEKILNKIHPSDIASTVTKFTSAYKAANLDNIAGILNEKIKTEYSSSKTLILQEYNKLFNITDKRDISFSNISWDRKNDTAIGTGRFEISLMEKGRFKEKTMMGDITLHMTKNYPDVSITEIYYTYDN